MNSFSSTTQRSRDEVGSRALRILGHLGVLCLGSLIAVESPAYGQLGATRSPEPNGSNLQTPKQDRNAKVIQVILREGTQVGPIRGRFVIRGQRWMFLVDGGKSDPAGVSEMIDGGVARKVTPETGSVLGRNRAVDGLASKASGTYSNADSSFANESIGRANEVVDKPSPSLRLNAFDQMIVLENLMLGRIATAIEQDPDDDVWNITARVTEFDDQNRLLLITAQRASAIR